MATPPEMNIEAASPDRAAQLRKQMVDDLVAEGTIVSAPVEAASIRAAGPDAHAGTSGDHCWHEDPGDRFRRV